MKLRKPTPFCHISTEFGPFSLQESKICEYCRMLITLLKHYLLSSRAGNLIQSISWLCLSAVAISIFAAIVILSVMNGLNDAIYTRTLAVEAHYIVPLNQKNKEELQNALYFGWLKNQENVSSYIVDQQDLILRTVDGLFSGALGKGLERDHYLEVVNNMQKNIDEDYRKEVQALSEGEVAIGAELAYSLGIFQGDELVLIPPESLLLPPGERPEYEKVVVKHIFQSNLPDVDSKFLFYDPVLTLNRWQKAASFEQQIEIRLENQTDSDLFAKDLATRVDRFESWKDRNASLLLALKLEKYAMGSFLVLTLIIASVSILSVLALVISQKRKDIALLMAMGMTKEKVIQLYSKLGFLLSGSGAIIGSLFAVLFCYLLDNYSFLSLPQDLFYDYKVPVRMSFSLNLLLLSLALGISYLGSYLPAKWSVQEGIAQILQSSNREK